MTQEMVENDYFINKVKDHRNKRNHSMKDKGTEELDFNESDYPNANNS